MRRFFSTVAVGVVATVAMAGCSADPGQTVATTSSSRPAVAAGSPSVGPVEQERQFIACMRGEGVDMSDHIPGDTSGRGALKHEIDDNGKGSDPAFQAALDKCVHFLPVVAPEPASADQLAKQREYAKCMRDNGVVDFPDPDAAGGSGWFWVKENDPVFAAAAQKCLQFIGVAGPESAGAGG